MHSQQLCPFDQDDLKATPVSVNCVGDLLIKRVLKLWYKLFGGFYVTFLEPFQSVLLCVLALWQLVSFLGSDQLQDFLKPLKRVMFSERIPSF